MDKTVREAKSGDKDSIILKSLLKKLKEILAEGKAARELKLNDEEKKIIKGLSLITAKPTINVLNTKDIVGIFEPEVIQERDNKKGGYKCLKFEDTYHVRGEKCEHFNKLGYKI